MRKIVFILLVSFYFLPSVAQDTVKFMQYNLLYYGKNVGGCNSSNNNIERKTEDLKKILKYEKPDIFAVNELDGEGIDPVNDDETYLLNNALNVDGKKSYRSAPFEEIYLANALFYNKAKFKLKSYQPIRMEVGSFEKIFNAYTLYYLSDDLGPGSDTTFVTCFVVHLKSGGGNDDIQERNDEVEVLRDFIAANYQPGDHFLLLGDLNVDSPGEGAFQQLINPSDNSLRFIDPVDAIGEWHDNSDYAAYHTQSTRTAGDCFSGGGMDDRFDFIMASPGIMDQATDISYVDQSYTTIGQDGQSFNSSLNTTGNTSVPDEIAEALFGASDHLPVSLDLEIQKNPANLLQFDTVFHQPEDIGADDSVFVYADITDTKEQVHSLKLFWQAGGEPFNETGEMSLEGNYYASSLPPVDDTDTVRYRIKGFDESGSEILESGIYTYSVTLHTLIQQQTQNALDDFTIQNPVKNQLKIEFTGNYPYLEMQLGRMDGRVVFNQRHEDIGKQEVNLPVEHLEPGIYWLKIRTGNELIGTRKVLIIN